MSSAPEIYSRPSFRCLVSVGFPLHRRMEDLFSKTDERSGRSWSNVVKQIEDRYRMATESPRFNDPDYMTKYMQEEFARFAHRFTEESPGLGTVLSKIAEEISPLSNNEIDDAFRDLNLRAMVLARECATEWGGQHSVLRASAMSPARLNLDVLSSQIVPSPVLHLDRRADDSCPDGEWAPGLFSTFFVLSSSCFTNTSRTISRCGKMVRGFSSEGYLFPVGRWWHTALGPNSPSRPRLSSLTGSIIGSTKPIHNLHSTGANFILG